MEKQGLKRFERQRPILKILEFLPQPANPDLSFWFGTYQLTWFLYVRHMWETFK
jgi:hypothetical protein